MSFGDQAYQHRFFRDPPIKNISYGPVADYSLRRAASLSPSLDYSYNTLLLDRYRKEAEIYKRYRKLGHYAPSYLPPLSRLATQPILDDYISPSVVYLDNPEAIQLANQARNSLLQRQRELMKVNQEKEKERERANQYHRKYNRLKNRVREETNIQRIREMEERRQRAEELDQQRRRMEEIEQAMSSISHQLAGNSRLLTENIRLKQDLQRSQMTRSRFLVLPSLTEAPVVLQKPPLDTQYKEMFRLRKQIGDLDRRLSNSSQK